MDVLHAIGNTSLVRLAKVVPDECAEIWSSSSPRIRPAA